MKTMELDDNQRTVLEALERKFIDGSHILHYHGVLDALGHLSFRHPFDPEVFIMSQAIAPGIISGPADLIQYHVSDAEPLDPAQTNGYLERHIHSEVYRRHKDVQAVVHSHADKVVPYSISGVPLRPIHQMSSFLGLGDQGYPGNYDVADFRSPGDVQDTLVRNEHLGAALAGFFDRGAVVALMRGHGMTVIGGTIEEVVFRAYYTTTNAGVETTAWTIKAAFSAQREGGGGGGPRGLKFLSEKEVEGSQANGSPTRPWQLWVREVEACKLYVNLAGVD